MSSINASLLPAPRKTVLVTHQKSFTSNIIDTIMRADKVAGEGMEAFSKTIPGNNTVERLRNLWAFVKYQIKYRADGPQDDQDVKTPAALWNIGTGDCKSKSIFTAAVLQNLGIPYSYRFTSYDSNPQPTHVYVVAHLPQGQDVIIDTVYQSFNSEKLFKHKKDMAGKVRLIQGLQTVENEPLPITGFGVCPKTTKISDELPEEVNARLRELSKLRSHLNRRMGQMERNILLRKIAMVETSLKGYKLPPTSQYARELNGLNDAAIGKFGDRIKKAAKNVGKAVKKAASKVADAAKKVGKTVLKAATLPQRLFVKGLLEISLPQAAPAFIYLFIKNPQTIASLTGKIGKKRAKQEKFKKFIVNTIGMKESHFMYILRKGIKKKYGMEPEQALKQIFGIAVVNGIGFLPIPPEAFGAAIKIVGKIIKKIMGLFGVKTDAPSADDAPAAGDIATESEEIAAALKAAQVDTNGEENFSEAGAGSGNSDKSENKTMMYVGLGAAALAVAYVATREN